MTPAYCLTLRQTPDRTAIAQAHLRMRGINAVMVQGIDGRAWGIGTGQWFADRRDAGNWKIPPGHVGLNLSHWMLWTHLWHAGVDEALIFEDDVTLAPDFAAQYAETRAALPAGWQFWYLGTVGMDADRRQVINDRLCRVDGCVFGTHAYAVRRSALPALLDGMQSCQDHVDIQLSRLLPKLDWYVSWPNLATQRTATGEWQGCCHQEHTPAPAPAAVSRQKAVEISQSIPGWCPYMKAWFIHEIITDLQGAFTEPLRCVELGVWWGASLLPAAFALRRGKITGIDPYTKAAAVEGLGTEGDEGKHRAAWEGGTYGEWEAARAGCPNAIAANGLDAACELRVAMPDDIAGEFGGPAGGLHYLHIDDSHSTVTSVRNVKTWLPKLLPGGVLVLDDATWPTVQSARALIRAELECVEKWSDQSPGRRWETYRRPA